MKLVFLRVARYFRTLCKLGYVGASSECDVLLLLLGSPRVVIGMHQGMMTCITYACQDFLVCVMYGNSFGMVWCGVAHVDVFVGIYDVTDVANQVQQHVDRLSGWVLGSC